MPSIAIIGTRGYPSYYGGFETAVRKLAPFLADQGWEVTVYGRPGATQVGDSSKDPRVVVVETFGFERKSLSTLTFGLTATIRAVRKRHDVVIVMNVANGFWLPILRAFGIPTLVNVDGIEWERAKWGRLARTVFHVGAKLTARHGTRMVFDSREIERRWGIEFRRDGEFIPYGGDAVGHQLPIDEGLTRRGYVLVVARFVPENTIPEFFDAAAALAKDIDIVIVGSSGYGGSIDEQARLLAEVEPRVQWLGHVSDDQRLYSLWQNAAVYFHGHSVGGTNPALVQAMALGVPIVARDTPYNREVLGDLGTFCAPNANDIERAVRELLSLQVQELDGLAEELRERARNSYSWDSINQSYHAAAQQLVAQKPRRGGK